MISLSDVKGQHNAVRYLSSCITSGRIAGSYLFSGPEGTGRALTAKTFIMTLICPEKGSEVKACGKCSSCQRINNFGYPDLNWIKPEKNKAIKIEEIRNVRNILSFKPYESDFNVCVVEDAHMMTREASNALLKVLEEPPVQALLILITSSKELLLPTVLSRCINVKFCPLSVEDTKNIIMANSNIPEETAYFLAYFSQGSPGKALEMINEDIEERKQDVLAMVENIIKEDNYSCLNWQKEGKDYLIEDIEMLIMFFRDIAMGKDGLEEMIFDRTMVNTEMYRFFKKYPVDELYRIIEKLINTKFALMGNVNPKLVVQMLPGMLRTH